MKNRSMKSFFSFQNNCFSSLESKNGNWFVWFAGITIAIFVHGIVVAASPPSANPPTINHESPASLTSAVNDSEIISDMSGNSPSNSRRGSSSAETANRSILRTSFYYVKPLHITISRKEEDISTTKLYEPTFRELHTALHHYRQMADGMVRDLSVSHEVALRTERLLFPNHHFSTAAGYGPDGDMMSLSFLSKKIEAKISKVATLLEQNAFVLEYLLKPFPVTVGYSQFTNSKVLDSKTNFVVGVSSKNTVAIDNDQTQFTFPPASTSQNANYHTIYQNREKVSSSAVQLARYIKPFDPSKTPIAPNDNGKSNDHRDYGMESEPYETAAHVIAHMARDWTADGESIRKDTHEWISNQLWKIFRERNESNCFEERSSLSPVLIPGAGMARLAFDIATAYVTNDYDRDDDNGGKSRVCFPFEVEAIDNSIVMAAAAYHLLNSKLLSEAVNLDFMPDCASDNEDCELASNYIQQDSEGMSYNNKQKMTIFPFVSDTFVNEVDTDRRWESASFPEDAVLEKMKHIYKQQQSQGRGNGQSHSKQSMQVPSLSYTVGDFVTTYASSAKHGMYGSVATCFFIDTATNIYEYILTIRNLLRNNGVWINLGPVQWHRNAQLQPSTNELRDIIELAGFRILHWEVSEKLVAYRHPDDVDSNRNQKSGVNTSKGARFTRSEAYRPLKFVAIRKEDKFDHADMQTQSHDDLLSALERVKLLTGRRSIFMPA